MSMSVGRPPKGSIADINVTPMADVMIVLLIIFMVVVPVAPSALDASLPDRARDATDALAAGAVFIRVADGVAHARVVDAIDAARVSGADRIGLVGETEERK